MGVGGSTLLVFAHLATRATSDSNQDFLRLNKGDYWPEKTLGQTLPPSVAFLPQLLWSLRQSEIQSHSTNSSQWRGDIQRHRQISPFLPLLFFLSLFLFFTRCSKTFIFDRYFTVFSCVKQVKRFINVIEGMENKFIPNWFHFTCKSLDTLSCGQSPTAECRGVGVQ